MVDGIGKKVKTKADRALEEVKRKAKQVAREEVEGYSKKAKSQLLSEEIATVPESNSNLGISGQKTGTYQENPDEEEERKKYLELKARLDEEVRVIKKKQEEKLGAWRQEQEQKMAEGKKEETETVVVLPSSPSKRPEVSGIVKGKQGTREMGKKISG